MAKQKVMEGINEETVTQVGEVVSNTNGNMITKLAVGALGVAAGIGAVIFFRNKKQNQELDAEEIEADSTEDNKENE